MENVNDVLLSKKENISRNCELNNLKFNIPMEFNPEADTASEFYERYVFSKENEVIAVIDANYLGENDFQSGEGKYDEEYNINSVDVISESEYVTDTIVVGTSVFSITLTYADKKVINSDKLFGEIVESVNEDNYVNTRESQGVTVSYKGDTEKDTEINSETKGITVIEKFTTVLGEGEKALDWTIKNPGKLEIDKTSDFTVIADGKEYSLKIRCTDVSEKGFKNICKTYSYDSLARNPEDYRGKPIKISGKIVQVVHDASEYRIATSGSNGNVFYVSTSLLGVYTSGISSNIVPVAMWNPESNKKRFLEGDYVTVYGYCDGIKTYTSVLGTEQQIPKIDARCMEVD